MSRITDYSCMYALNEAVWGIGFVVDLSGRDKAIMFKIDFLHRSKGQG